MLKDDLLVSITLTIIAILLLGGFALPRKYILRSFILLFIINYLVYHFGFNIKSNNKETLVNKLL